jgi:protein-S-isoprenylcysteine O-methyltransferase Ste14
MATLAACMLAGFLVLTLFVRVAIQLRRTGKTGLIGLRRNAGLLDVLSGLLFLGGMALGVVSLQLVLQDSLEPIDALDNGALHVLGIALAAVGGTAVFLAQLGMGASWRIGVSDDERTDLVTTGWFSLCRNPIYTAMVVGWTGFALLVPTWLAFAAVVVIAVGLELQVRAVEEPYLLRTHGDEYRAYASRVGRFVPGIGRLAGR